MHEGIHTTARPVWTGWAIRTKYTDSEIEWYWESGTAIALNIHDRCSANHRLLIRLAAI